MGFVEERIFHPLRVSLDHFPFVSLGRNERNASLRIKEERRLQTAPATPVNGDPHKPIVFPFPSLFAAGGDSNGSFPPRNPVDVVTVTRPAPLRLPLATSPPLETLASSTMIRRFPA